MAVEEWDPSSDVKYRITHRYINSGGKNQVATYDGTIRKDPVDRPLRMGTITCQFSNGFPYSPLVKNLELSDPYIL